MEAFIILWLLIGFISALYIITSNTYKRLLKEFMEENERGQVRNPTFLTLIVSTLLGVLSFLLIFNSHLVRNIEK